MNKNLIPATLAVTMLLAACGDSAGSDTSAQDDERTCRIAQRLVDDTADGDPDGIERQLERLGEVDGIDDRTDLDELADLASSGADRMATDLADQLDDDLGCEIDVPEIAAVLESAPADTVPEPVVTEPAVTTPEPTPVVTDVPDGEPVVTDAPATTSAPTSAPTTDAPVSTDAASATEPGEAFAVVDIAATGPGIDRSDLAQSPADAVAASGISVIPIPAGDAAAIEYDISFDLDTFSDDAAFTSREEFTFTAATDMSLEDVKSAFVTAIVDGYEMEFSVTDSTATRDEVTQTATTLSPDRSRQGVPRYDVVVATSSETPGVVVIEISAGDYREGALPAFTPAAAEGLGTAAEVGNQLGLTLEGWRWSPGFNQFSGNASRNGGLDWHGGTGEEADVIPLATSLLELVPTPTFEDIEDDRHFYIVSDSENWSVRYSDVYEDREMRVSYSFGD